MVTEIRRGHPRGLGCDRPRTQGAPGRAALLQPHSGRARLGTLMHERSRSFTFHFPNRVAQVTQERWPGAWRPAPGREEGPVGAPAPPEVGRVLPS